ncbi:hypothetical protein PF005_g24879 [Phytophthora fragariae]|uniref:Alcohol dehydrogenase-like C-terminal domain-containing protein n=2 Tax=Phytophthora fragariae TaxID=53985 RepID=A0A6A3W012_9STRA|nr:hypothetical protein PF003_g1457 [Phytophthora fragariae]KAE9069930.1 hypothetical protein PF007_g27130 [Phytophthora fragariae]KAE9079518.1 hypothetical protein PF010_g22726 [Phytophthora fragariae]KAE9176569.1 hypothetical protein PF005_g24879 [Phytophthora fragariae]KAE9189357.1 hypothetical protein PF004_g22235 [Phytophthora fragariae]
MSSSRASSHLCSKSNDDLSLASTCDDRAPRVKLPMDKEFLPLDSPTQDEVELEQEHVSRPTFKTPDNNPLDVAAPLLCVGAPAFTPFKEVGIKPGDRVGILDIGCMGHLGIQFTKTMGAAVVLVFSSLVNKEQEIRRVGADDFVVYTDAKQAADSANSVDILLITADVNNMPYTLLRPVP